MTNSFESLKNNPNRWKYFLWLAVFVLIAYLPLSSFQFALKNDAFIYNFPNKYFFSEALRAGHIPFWNPYLNYGFPLFADPGFAWWHPLTWLFGFIGYNPYTFTIELLTYLFIAALGMYWLARQFGLKQSAAFIMGCMFAASGFFVGNMQHINFLTCAAFLPWVPGTWYNLQQNPSLKKAAFAAIATYLLCTAGHPAIPIGTIYFMFFFALLYFFAHRKKVDIKTSFLWNGCYLLLTLLLLLPPLLSWLQLMPFYVRSEGVDHVGTSQLGFSVPSYISFLSPLTTIKGSDFFATDVSMRNGYFSLFGFISFVAAVFQNKNRVQKIFLWTGMLMLVLSLSGAVKTTLYANLPLLNFIRTNGEFRVFALLCFILVSGAFLNHLQYNDAGSKRLERGLKFLGIVLMGAFVVLVGVLFTSTGAATPGPNTFSATYLKTMLDQLSFTQALLGGVVVCLAFCAAYYFCLRKAKSFAFICLLILADLVLNTWLLLPVTGVGIKNVATLSDKINLAPKGFPLPSLKYEMVRPPVSEADELRIGNWSWYDKKIVHKRIEYPSALKSTEAFYNAGDTLHMQKPFAFLKNNQGTITLEHFDPNTFLFSLKLGGDDTLVLMQNYYPGWKAFNNGSPALLNYNGFIGVALSLNDSTVNFKFAPYQR